MNEINVYLHRCISGHCGKCKYQSKSGCDDLLKADAAAEIDRLTAELAAEKAKREAAEKYIPHRCELCASLEKPVNQEPCASCDQNRNFEWRGLDDALNGRR